MDMASRIIYTDGLQHGRPVKVSMCLSQLAFERSNRDLLVFELPKQTSNTVAMKYDMAKISNLRRHLIKPTFWPG